MHRIRNVRRHGLTPWRDTHARLRAERHEVPTIVRRRRFSHRGVALTVYYMIWGFAAVVASLTVGLVASA